LLSEVVLNNPTRATTAAQPQAEAGEGVVEIGLVARARGQGQCADCCWGESHSRQLRSTKSLGTRRRVARGNFELHSKTHPARVLIGALASCLYAAEGPNL